MGGTILDLVVIVLILGMTYALSSEGLWGAALMFFNVLLATMITMNFYEPLAQMIGTNVSFLSGFADALCIMVIFSVTLLILRLLTEYLGPVMVRYPAPVYHLGRLVFAFLASVLAMGVMLLALDASPVDKKIFGAVDHKRQPFYGVRLDKEVLAIFQYSTGQIFKRTEAKNDPFGQYGNARVFDPKGAWLVNAFEARPYGKEGLFEEEKPSTEGATPAGGAPGAPGSPAGKPGPGIPGGNAGAAVGLAPTTP